MADEYHFAYRVQLPDGSEAIRQGAAPQAPTFGQLADFSANRGERFLGMVPMSPAPETPPPQAPPPAPTPPPSPTPGLIEGALQSSLPAPGPGLLNPPPERSFASQLPSLGGGLAGGTAGAMAGAMTGPLAPVMVPTLAILGAAGGSGLMEAWQARTEAIMGERPAEPGTVAERATRAAARGAAGEAGGQAVRIGGQVATRGAQPVLGAAERLEPVLTREVPEATRLVHAPEGISGAVRGGPIDAVLKDPVNALKGVTLTPETQQTLLTRWWQTTSAGRSPKAVVTAWDALGPEGQHLIAGAHLEDMATVVDTLRGVGGKALLSRTPIEFGKAGILPTAAYYVAGPTAAKVVGGAQELMTSEAPRLLLYPRTAGWIARLPEAGRVARPWADVGVRTAGQVGAAEFAPPVPLREAERR